MEKTIDGITVNIIHKPIKNIYIRVGKDGSVTMSAPLRISGQVLERFFKDNAAAVKRAIARRKLCTGGDYLSDGYIYIFGIKKRFHLRCGTPQVVETADGVVLYADRDDRRWADRQITLFLKKKLCEQLDCLIAYWERKTGLESQGYSVKIMETRWGSCNCYTKKLNFSVYLADMPLECVSYVVLHEICHIRYADHGAGFKAMLTRYMPEWKVIRKRLNGECEIMKYLSGDCK